MFRIKGILALTAAAALAGVAGCSTMGSQSAATQQSEDQTLALKAANVLQSQMQKPDDKRIPAALVRSAQCIGVFPAVNQAAFIVGGKHGAGLVACRNGSNSWNDAAPAVYSLNAGSVGFQAGVQQQSFILLFMNREAAEHLTGSNFKLGADIGVAAGPLGYNAAVNTTPAPIISYRTDSEGLFAGVNLNGTVMDYNEDANSALYGSQSSAPRQVLFQTQQVPSSMNRFNQALAQLESQSQQNNQYGP